MLNLYTQATQKILDQLINMNIPLCLSLSPGQSGLAAIKALFKYAKGFKDTMLMCISGHFDTPVSLLEGQKLGFFLLSFAGYCFWVILSAHYRFSVFRPIFHVMLLLTVYCHN